MEKLDALRRVAKASAVFSISIARSGQVGEIGALPGVPDDKRRMSARPKSKSQERGRLVRTYDETFVALSHSKGPGQRSENLELLKPLLYELSPELRAWTGDVRLRVHLLVKEMLKELDDPACAKASLGLLVLILSQGGRNALELVRPAVRERIMEMYQEGHQSERLLPRLMLMLDDYELELVEQVTNDAIHQWDDERFREVSGYLGLGELKEKDQKNKVRRVLGGEIANAAVEKNGKAFRRALELYHDSK